MGVNLPVDIVDQNVGDKDISFFVCTATKIYPSLELKISSKEC